MSALSKYKTYPEYKDSGIEWLGEIPNNWINTSIKYGYNVTLGKMLQKEKQQGNDLLKPYLKAQNIQPFGLNLENVGKMWFSHEERKRLSLQAGDVLVSEGGDVGRSAIWQNELDECYIQNALNRVRSENNNTKYFLYWISFLKETDYINILCNKATIAHYTAEKLKDSPLLLPSIQEQTKIAQFLDHETAKIDQLIEKQQTLIELLKEKRQAVISHAVTKGLDPNVKMKDSGVEWLGEVPEHWNVKPFKRFFKIRKRIAGTLGYEILSITQKGIKIKDIESGDGQLSMDYSKYQIVNKGDFAMNHMDLLTGFVDVSPYLGVTSPDYRVFTLEDSLSDSQYYLYLLQMCYINKIFYPLGQGAANVGRWRLPTEAFNEFNAPVPPSVEQKKISAYIDKNLNLYAKLVEKAESQIGLLKERRTALISAAVTGKIDVRDWQPEQ